MTSALFPIPDAQLVAPELIHDQRSAFKLIGIFRRHPILASFSCTVESHFNGGDEQALIALHEAEITQIDPADPELAMSADREISAFLNGQSQTWLGSRRLRVYSRPGPNEPFEEALARQFMEPAHFALWQAALLSQSTPNSLARLERPNSI